MDDSQLFPVRVGLRDPNVFIQQTEQITSGVNSAETGFGNQLRHHTNNPEEEQGNHPRYAGGGELGHRLKTVGSDHGNHRAQ